MRVAILDDTHRAYEETPSVRRLRDRVEVKIFFGPFGEPSALGGFDAVVANRERTRFSRALMEQLPDLRIIAQTGAHAYHIDLDAAEERRIIVAKATGDGRTRQYRSRAPVRIHCQSPDAAVAGRARSTVGR